MSADTPAPPDHTPADGECHKHDIGPVDLRKQRVAGMAIKFCPLCACKGHSAHTDTDNGETNE